MPNVPSLPGFLTPVKYLWVKDKNQLGRDILDYKLYSYCYDWLNDDNPPDFSSEATL